MENEDRRRQDEEFKQIMVDSLPIDSIRIRPHFHNDFDDKTFFTIEDANIYLLEVFDKQLIPGLRGIGTIEITLSKDLVFNLPVQDPRVKPLGVPEEVIPTIPIEMLEATIHQFLPGIIMTYLAFHLHKRNVEGLDPMPPVFKSLLYYNLLRNRPMSVDLLWDELPEDAQHQLHMGITENFLQLAHHALTLLPLRMREDPEREYGIPAHIPPPANEYNQVDLN